MTDEQALNDHDRKIVETAKEDFLDRWIRRRGDLTEAKVREGEASTGEAILEAAYRLGDSYTVRSEVHLNNPPKASPAPVLTLQNCCLLRANPCALCQQAVTVTTAPRRESPRPQPTPFPKTDHPRRLGSPVLRRRADPDLLTRRRQVDFRGRFPSHRLPVGSRLKR